MSSTDPQPAASAHRYAEGDWYAVFGAAASVVLPPEHKHRVAALWELVDGGAGFEEVLDAVIAQGLRDLPAFVVLGPAADGIRAVVRGPVTARFEGAEAVVLDGTSASTWVEQTVAGADGYVVEFEDAGEASLRIGSGLARVGRIEAGAAASDAPVESAVAEPEHEPAAQGVPEEQGAPAPESEPEPGVEADLAADPEIDVAPEPVAEPNAEPAAAPVSDPGSDAGLDSGSDAGFDSGPEPAPEAEPDLAIELPDEPTLADLAAVPATPAPPMPAAVAPPGPFAPGDPVPPPPPPSAFAGTPEPPVSPEQPHVEEPVAGSAEHDGHTRAGDEHDLPAPPEVGLPGQPQPPAVTAKPVAGLLFSSGQTVEVDRAIIVGRAPEARRFSPAEQPKLVTVPSPAQEISSTHLEVRPGAGADHGSAVVTDLGSTNGTVLIQPGLPPEDLQPGIAVQLIPGAIVDLGDGVTIQVINP